MVTVTARIFHAAGWVGALATLAVGSCRDTHVFPIRSIDASMSGSTGGARGDAVADLPDGQSPDGAIVCPPITRAPIGFASDGVGTFGGESSGAPVMVVAPKTAVELKIYAMAIDPLLIEISGPIALTEQIEVASYKTIRGTNSTAALIGGGLFIKDSQNVVVQKMTISKVPYPNDAITIQHSDHVWIDHCEFFSSLDDPKGTYDGLVDITHASEWITVSWSYFHNHYNVGLIGHSAADSAVTEDTGHFHVTYHHNWFSNVGSNTPRIRFGTVHLFNNLFDNVAGNAIASVMGAETWIEDNVFRNVSDSVETTYENDPQPGTVSQRNNRFDAASVIKPTVTIEDWPAPWPPYPYAADLSPVDAVPDLVPACAGPK